MSKKMTYNSPLKLKNGKLEILFRDKKAWQRWHLYVENCDYSQESPIVCFSPFNSFVTQPMG